jgi:hypothetical protein
MKRIVIGAVLVLGLIGTANANSKDPQRAAKANLPDCRGISSPEQIRSAKTANADPAVAFAKKHRATAMPASVVCQSKLWQALHGKIKVATSKRLSPDGRRALSGRVGSGPIRIEDSPVQAYEAPQADLRPVHPVHAPPLRNVHPLPPPRRGEDNNDKHPEPIRPVPPTQSGGPDGPVQTVMGPVISAPTAVGSGFDGVGVGVGGFSPSSNPPDVNGHVGATQYVQWNNTSFAVFSKAGALLYGPAAGNTLFQSLGGICATHNDGDPVVNYDVLAGRWILSQFAVDGPAGSASHQCVAVSVSDDALGSYYLYDFVTDTTNFVDYPHVGVWPDGYYMTAHVFNAAGTAQVAGRVYVFERDKMILGQSARMQQSDLSKDGSAFQYGFLPADVDSVTPPPAGEASFILGPNGQFTNRTDSTRVAVTWGVTPAITLTSATITTVGIVSPACVNNTAAQQNRDCVPQPSPAVGADYLDSIEFHFMYRLPYRNFGGSPLQESLVVSAPTAGSASTPGHGAIKWIEFRNAGNSTATPTVFQSGTFDPDTSYRWLPSAAMDKDHNIAIGYSKSSTSVKPGIFMTGRLGTDTINTMGAETTVTAGIGSQTSGAGNRWGDYSAMTLDPVDQCTFWYTNEYLKTNGAFNWSTRIATYKFPSCTSAASWGTVSGTITSCATGAPLSGVVVSLSNGFAGATDASGNYSIPVPAGTYNASAADANRNCTTGSPATVSVIATSGATTTQNFCMSGSSNLQTNGFALDDATNGNNNGVINRDECVKLTLPLKNNGCANESAISATLSTSTPGVTVTQSASAYPDLAIDTSGNNATAFQFQTSSSFVCGTTISFTLTANYAGGSKALAISFPTCGGGANQTIPSSSLTAADLTQSDRLGRDGVPSTCANKTNAAGGFAGTKYYKTFTFTNNSALAACFTLNLTAALGGAGDIESAAYSPSYNPASITTNFLGDTGISGLGTTVGSAQYSFTVPALATFVIVVNTTGTTTSSVFSGTVSGFANTTAGPGACPACVPPATPAASNGGPYCAGGTIALSTPTVAGATYAWTGPNGFSSLLQNPTRTNATAADAGTYSVTVTVASCTSLAGTTSVVVNPVPATPTASNSGPYCAGATISLSTPTVAGATYAWTGPNAFTSATQNPTRASATAADAGTYSVTVTVSGCTSAAGTTSVIVNAVPATPSASNGGPYCAGGTIALSTPTVAGATYAWTGPNAFTSALQNPTRSSATAADAGTYSVTVTVSGCTSAAGTTSVIVNPVPATPSASNGGPYCAGATIALSTPTAAGATYAWTGPNGFTSALQNPTRSSATIADGGTYSVTITVSGCSSAAGTTTVVVNATPATPTASNGGPYCAGATIALSTPTIAGATYAWSGPNGFASSLQNPTRASATTADAGTYSVTITVSGCTSAAGTTTVVVNAIPATPTASNGGPYCAGGTIALSTPTVAGATYAWTGPNGFTSALQNPTRSSATTADAGIYSVTVTVSGCTSAAGTTTVVVNAAPATPTASNGGPYCQGATIALSTPTVAGATYAWTGPNGFASSLQNATRASATTADAGTYSVTITVSGCTSAAGTTTVVVNATPATPTASNGGPYCAGGTIALSTPTVAGATYAWTGPNGFTSALQNPTRASATTADAGIYSVTITVSGCISAAGTTTVIVNAIPATPTTSNGGPYCAGATIALSTATIAGATYAWTGPNGFISALQNPTRSSATTVDAGIYSLTITVSGCTSAAGSMTVVVNAAPATPSASNGGPYCAGSTSSLSTPTVAGATYAWTGPNGFTSALQNPTRASATTTDAGSYSVTITVSGCTSAAGTTIVAVNATPATPTASNGGPYCAGATIALSTPSVAGATYAWTGPNSFTSTLQNPTRSSATTADAGIYSVTVSVSGCSSAAGTTTVVVNATPATPTASNGGPFCAGATIALSTPTVAGATYAWTGPNGFTSALQNPTRASATTPDAGTYSVTATVSGCTSAAGTTTVVVNAPATPPASNGGPYCAGATIALSTPSVAGATYAWSGPNDFTSALQNPTRASATTADAGIYSVTVAVSGCTSAAGTTTVVVNATPATPTASNGGPYCAGATIALSTPTVAGATYAWTGPNGFASALQNPTRSSATTADAGIYSVTITVSGCTSAAGTTTVVMNAAPATPTASNGGPSCEGATISLATPTVGGATYAWTGPNGFTSALQNPTRSSATTADAGIYSVTVTVSGCTSAAGTTTVVVNATPATPTASNGSPYCAGSTIALSTPTVAGATYAWTGPNGFTSGVQNPTRSSATAADAGLYSVTITVTGCGSAAGTTSVTVNPIPATPTTTPGGPTTVCAGGSVLLTSSSASGNQWLLNGSPIASATSDTYSATASGTYTVTVTASGCTSAASVGTSITVNPIPATPTITPGGPTTFCAGGSVLLTSSSASGNQWLLNGTPIGIATSNTYSATASGSYTVIVTTSGCSSVASSATVVTVNAVPSTPAITPMSATTFCSGGSVTLTSSAGPAYQWFLDGGSISGAMSQTYSASANGSYTVQVTSAGCSALSSAQTVTVNPLPATPTITAEGPTTMCGSGSVTLTSSSATSNLWSDGGPASVGTNQTLVVTTSGTYRVWVRDVNGCDSDRSNSITVTFNLVPTAEIRDGYGNAGSTTICAGTNINLLAHSTAGATYTWTRDGQPVAGTSDVLNVTQAGSYTNTVTAPNGCSATSAPFIVNVNSVATPTINAGGPTTFCTGGSVTLTSSAANGNQWYFEGNQIVGATNKTYSVTASGSYAVTVTASGCRSAAATTNVVVNPIPATPTLNAGGPTTFCAGGSVLLTSSSASGNQWYLNGGPIGGATNNTYSANATGNYAVTATASGCTSPASAATAVTVNPIPATPTITPGGPTTFCAGGSVTLTSSSTSGNQWFLNGSPIGGATNQTYSASVNANYTVAVTTSGCTSAPAVETLVTVNFIPNASIVAPTPVVAGSTGHQVFVSDAGTGATYNWIISNGTITAGAGTNSIMITAGAAGTLTINVTVTTAAGCSDAKSVNVNVTAAAPAVTVTSVSPVSGSTSGGTPVTINGTGFLSGAAVTFGGTAATNVVVVSAIKITARTPVHAAGSVNVTVTNTNASTATLTSGYLYAMLFDANGDGVVDPADIFYLINYLFLGGPAPHGAAGLLSGDANGDGVIDPSDVFYLINYLFLGGSQPHAVPGTPAALSVGSATPRIAGSIALGKPVRRAGHYIVPVILTSRGEVTPEAMSLSVRLESEAAIGDVAIRRAGVAKDVVFETSRRLGNDVSYLVAYDPRGLALGTTGSAVVAEIEIESVEGGIAIDIDPRLTMLGDLAGTKKATAANQRLELSGTTTGNGALPRPRMPRDQVN